jgi:Zn-dependent M28 family amino/carboxypeptidase
VFAGFGIVAPEYHWNDYAGLDVKGKTVIVLVNDPGYQSGKPTFFKGDTMTYYGRWTYKYEEAARQGAAGVLIVHQTKPASYPWSVVQSSFTGAHLYLKDTAGHRGRCKMEGWITYDAAKRLLASAGIRGDFTAMARKRGFKPVPLNEKLSVGFTNHIRYNVSHNVIAVFPGSRTPPQYLIYTAHWDHLGVGIPVSGDSIYNGAVDNASGVGALLAIAKAYTLLSEKPARSIVFLAVTAEEQGLLGSGYYGEHPVYPLNRTVADLNMDALGNYGKTSDIVITGLGQSYLEEDVSEIAAAKGLTVRGDLNPASGSYFRSDHFSFAKVGVPSLDINNGLESVDHDKAWTDSVRREFGQHHYHQPSDEYSPDMNADGMVEIARILFELGCKLGSEITFPGWKPGSAFKARRAAMMSK